MKTLVLSVFVAIATLIAVAVVGFGFFVSGGGVIYPSMVAWIAGSVFAFERRPRHLWLHVATIGVVVAAVINLYFAALPRLFPPPPGALRGGPNMPMPAQPLPPPK